MLALALAMAAVGLAMGDARAQYLLSPCHGRGTGCAKDEEAAVRWLRRSAAAGFVPAEEHLHELERP